ncbi:FHA domain-containing protein [Cohnella yongneupensis]|uniref:FHA domain-containing protein n=1 Tax=Cohnella yongneupensis TaxID=425006 RepID=A0ABW0R469_9BACL
MRSRRLLREGKAIRTTSVALIGLTSVPAQVAAAPITASKAQVTVGTLPLLAALGLGIAVAIVAVIAFLQMTAKGKIIGGQLRSDMNEDADMPGEPDAEPWNDEESGTEFGYDEDTLTDYTIPITQILAQVAAAEPAQEGEPRLCGIEGEHAGASYRLMDRRLLIGRDAIQCGVVFPYEAGEVSRRHCTVRYNPETKMFLLEDHGSSNGTFLASGIRLEPGKQYELRDGDRFSLSGAAHSFEVKAGD